MTNTFSIEVSKALREIGIKEHKAVPAVCSPTLIDENGNGLPSYDLVDILRLMTKIAVKTKAHSAWNCTTKLVAHFKHGDYPTCEKYLLSILSKDEKVL